MILNKMMINIKNKRKCLKNILRSMNNLKNINLKMKIKYFMKNLRIYIKLNKI